MSIQNSLEPVYPFNSCSLATLPAKSRKRQKQVTFADQLPEVPLVKKSNVFSINQKNSCFKKVDISLPSVDPHPPSFIKIISTHPSVHGLLGMLTSIYLLPFHESTCSELLSKSCYVLDPYSKNLLGIMDIALTALISISIYRTLNR